MVEGRVLPPDEVTTIDHALPDGRMSPFPVLRCRNIYVLPGVPQLLQQKWKVSGLGPCTK
jgi:hypothetical protein